MCIETLKEKLMSTYGFHDGHLIEMGNSDGGMDGLTVKKFLVYASRFERIDCV
jgi:hypothetical protein